MNSYDVGNIAFITGTFTDSTGAPIDPETVVIKVKDPTGTVTSYTPVRVSTGIYTYNLSLTIAGKYFYRFEGTGGATAAGDNLLTATHSPVLGCC